MYHRYMTFPTWKKAGLIDRKHAVTVHYNFLNGFKSKIAEMKRWPNHWLVPGV